MAAVACVGWWVGDVGRWSDTWAPAPLTAPPNCTPHFPPISHLPPPPPILPPLQFIIATIPTVLGVNESARLIRALRAEQIPCRRIVVNQIITPGMGAK